MEGDRVKEFGGATSAVLVEAGGQNVFLDAGTGLHNVQVLKDGDITILISHSHLDHLLGLPFFRYLSMADRKIDIYLKKRNGLSAKEQIDSIFSPPAWPCLIGDYMADITFHDLECPFNIGEIRVSGMESVHPGGSTIYRLDYKGTSLVFATDYEYRDEKAEELISFSKGTDLLLFDAQYTEEEQSGRRGFGHSTAAQGISVFEKAGAGILKLIHHAPEHDDGFMRQMEEDIKARSGKGDRISFARQGEVIEL